MVRGRLRRLGLDERPFRRSSRGSAACAAQSEHPGDGGDRSGGDQPAERLDLYSRYGTEYGGLAERDAQGRERRAGPSALRRDAEARRQSLYGQSEGSESDRRLYSGRRRRLLVGASLHLPRLPLRRDHGPELQSRAEKLRRQGSLRRYEDDRPFRDFRSDDQSGVQECLLGHSRQLPQHADRLSSARRAHGLARRPCYGLYRRELRVRQYAALREVAARHRSDAGQRGLRARCGSGPLDLRPAFGQRDLAGGLSLRGRHAL